MRDKLKGTRSKIKRRNHKPCHNKIQIQKFIKLRKLKISCKNRFQISTKCNSAFNCSLFDFLFVSNPELLRTAKKLIVRNTNNISFIDLDTNKKMPSLFFNPDAY